MGRLVNPAQPRSCQGQLNHPLELAADCQEQLENHIYSVIKLLEVA